MRALLRGCHLVGAVRLWSRHATPRAFSHLLLTGPTGRALLSALDPVAAGVFAFGHPTLGDWSGAPAQFKQPDGSVLHQFAGVTPLDGGEPLEAEDYAARDTLELYVLGHVERYASGYSRGGVPLLGLQLTTSTLLAAINPAAIVWRSDGAVAWADVSTTFKRADGSPRVNLDRARTTPIISYVDPASVPPM